MSKRSSYSPKTLLKNPTCTFLRNKYHLILNLFSCESYQYNFDREWGGGGYSKSDAFIVKSYTHEVPFFEILHLKRFFGPLTLKFYRATPPFLKFDRRHGTTLKSTGTFKK